MNLNGVGTALITPFLSNGDVDLAGLKKNIATQLNAGINYLLPLGTTGETPTLEQSEIEAILTTTVETVAGSVPVMVGTGSNSTKKTIAATRLAREMGADIALVVSPYYNRPSQAGLLQHFEAVLEAVDIPIVIYNIKGRTGVNIETATLARLVENPNVIGVKEASGDIHQIGDVIAQLQSTHDHFSVLSGDDSLTLPLMALGGRGVISVASNIVPEHVGALVNDALHGNWDSARRKHYQLLPLFHALFIESNPVPLKAAMTLCGLPAGECRLPLSTMQESNIPVLKEALTRLQLLP